MEDVEDPWDAFVRPHHDQLVKSMRLSMHLDRLYAQRLVDSEEYKQLQRADDNGTNRAVQILLMDILPKKLPKWKYFSGFIEVLEACEHQRALADLIRPPSPPRAADTTEAASGEEAMDVSSPQAPVSTDGPHSEPAAAAEAAAREGEAEIDEETAEESSSADRPEEKIACIYVQTSDEVDFGRLENRLKSMLKHKLGIHNVMILPESSEQTTGSNIALVVSSKMKVHVLLGGIERDEFAKIKPHFELTIATFFKVRRNHVNVEAEFDGSVGLLIQVPMNVALEMACLMGEEEGEALFANDFKTALPEVTGLTVFIGGLPAWNVPLPAEPLQRSGTREEVLSQIPGDIDVKNAETLVNLLADSDLNLRETYTFMTTTFPTLLAAFSPDEQQEWKDELLFHAAARNLLTFSILLVDIDADPTAIITDPKTDFISTSFHAATSQSNARIVQFLIAASADQDAAAVNVIDTQHDTPLHYSARLNDVACAKLLLAADADPIARNKFGYTPAHLAARVDVGDEGPIFDLLREAGAHFNMQSKRLRYTPLDVAVRCNNDNAVVALMRHGANPTLKSRFALRAIHHASGLGSRQCFESVLLNGGDPKDVSLLGNALELGLARGQTDIKDFMIDSLLGVVRYHKETFMVDAEKAFEAQRELEKTNEDLSHELDLVENRCSSLYDESKKLKRQVDELEKKVNEQQDQAKSNKEEMDKMAQTVQEKQEELAKEVEEQTKFTEQLNKEVEQIKQLHEELQKTVEEQTKDLEKMSAEEDSGKGETEASGGDGAAATASALPRSGELPPEGDD